MRSLDFPGVTGRYGAPKDWDEAKNGPCEILCVQNADGCCLSLWAPDEKERSQIAQGHPVELRIAGGQPPVIVSVSPSHRVGGVDDEVDIFAAGAASERKRLSEAVLASAEKLASDGAVTIDDLKAILAIC